MASFKKIIKSDGFRKFACLAAAGYIWLVHATGRWSAVGRDVPEALWRRREPFILCFWHGRLLMMPYAWDRSRPIRVLTSDHRDGRLIAASVVPFGITSIVGSSTRGGSSAFRQMLRSLRAGESIGMSPDGPRGPRMRAREGAAVLARHAGVPVIPIAYSARRRRVLGTWDRFIVALPFTRGVYVWGPALDFSPAGLGSAPDGGRKALEDALLAVTAEADRLCGHAPVEAAPVAAEPVPS